ncbi:MAG: DUF3365 domain-containing protein [Candidatus Zixiibacteriota bacterium]
MYRNIVMTIMLVSLLSIFSCGNKTTPKIKDELISSLQDINKADLAILRQASAKKIESFTMAAKRTLSESIRSYGLVESIDICSDFVPELSMSDSQKGIELNRISSRNRNKNNTPDSIQTLILDKFEKNATRLEYYEDFRKINNENYYLFYKPIYMEKNCLNCHGDIKQMSEDLNSKLTELYPDDNAVGYNEGDFRGLFVISIKYPDGLEYSKILAAGI